MKTSLCIFLVVASFVGGTFFGFQKGIDNYYRLESLPRALIDTGMYKKIEAGKLDAVKNLYQFNIEQAIDNYIWYEENAFPILPNILLKEHVNEKERYINQLIIFHSSVPNKDISHLLEGDIKDFYVDAYNKRYDFVSKRISKLSPNK